MTPSNYILVMATVGSEKEAAAIGSKVVEEGLAACTNIVSGLRSIYRWKGEICDEAEVLCLFKTRASLFEPLKKRIIELHSYELPEVIAVDITEGSDKYLAWIEESTTLLP